MEEVAQQGRWTDGQFAEPITDDSTSGRVARIDHTRGVAVYVAFFLTHRARAPGCSTPATIRCGCGPALIVGLRSNGESAIGKFPVPCGIIKAWSRA